MITLRGMGAGARCTLNYLTISYFDVELFMARGSKMGAWCMMHGVWCMVHGAWCIEHGTSKGNRCRSSVTLNYLAIRSFEFELFMARRSKTGAWSMVHGVWCMVHGPWCKLHGTSIFYL